MRRSSSSRRFPTGTDADLLAARRDPRHRQGVPGGDAEAAIGLAGRPIRHRLDLHQNRRRVAVRPGARAPAGGGSGRPNQELIMGATTSATNTRRRRHMETPGQTIANPGGGPGCKDAGTAASWCRCAGLEVHNCNRVMPHHRWSCEQSPDHAWQPCPPDHAQPCPDGPPKQPPQRLVIDEPPAADRCAEARSQTRCPSRMNPMNSDTLHLPSGPDGPERT